MTTNQPIGPGATRERLALELRRARRPFAIWVTVVAMGLFSAGVLLSKLSLPWPWQHVYTFDVAVADASGVVAGDDVRIAGVPVGRITGVSLAGAEPVVAATMSSQYGPIYRDARIALRPNTPLQDMYLDIESRGQRSAGALPSGGTLPAAQTEVAVRVGEVVDIFDQAVRPRVRAAIDALGVSLGSQGDNFRRALTELAPFLSAAQRLTAVLAERRLETERLVHNFGLMTTVLADRQTQLQSVVAGGSITLERIASVEQSFSQLIEQLPPTLRVMPPAFTAVRAAAAQLDPALTALLPAAVALRPALASLERLSPTALRALTALDRPLPSLTALLQHTAPLSSRLADSFSELRPQAPRLNHITAAIVPCELAVDRFFNWTLSTMKYYGATGVIPRAATHYGQDTASLLTAKYLAAGPSCAGGAPAPGTGTP